MDAKPDHLLVVLDGSSQVTDHQPDATLPNGIPNPLLPGNRQATAQGAGESSASALFW